MQGRLCVLAIALSAGESVSEFPFPNRPIPSKRDGKFGCGASDVLLPLNSIGNGAGGAGDSVSQTFSHVTFCYGLLNFGAGERN